MDRRTFVSAIGVTGAAWGLPLFATDLGSGAGQPKDEREDEEVTPTEDLMREHGVLKRVLLVYDEAVRRLDAREELPPDAIHEGAVIIRTFIEDYHEKLEEDYLFPRFEKAGQLVDLTRVLREQHQAGRRVTEQITQLATLQTLKTPQSAAKLRDLLHQFTRMYQPHEAREDRFCFPPSARWSRKRNSRRSARTSRTRSTSSSATMDSRRWSIASRQSRSGWVSTSWPSSRRRERSSSSF